MARRKPKPKPEAKVVPVPDEQAALLTAIISHPDDDAPRLVYADWLQEHNDEEQAQFIRDSIKHAAMKRSNKAWAALHDRLRPIGRDRGRVWLKPFGISSGAPNFHRGMAESLFYEAPEDYFREEEAIFRYLPIRALGFGIGSGTGFTNEHLKRLAKTAELARLKSLGLHDHMDCRTKYWRDLFHSPHLANLTSLHISECEFTNAEVEALAASPSLQNLTELELSNNWIGLAGCRALAESSHLKKLKILSVTNNDFGNDDDFEEAAKLLEKRFGDLDCSQFEEDDWDENEGEDSED